MRYPFSGRVLMIGYGSIGHCTMPLLLKHLALPLDRITVLEPDDHHKQIADYEAGGLHYVRKQILPNNIDAILHEHVGRGDLILNLSVNVSSLALMEWCQKEGVLYLDTCLEPWEEDQGYTNQELREQVQQAAKRWPADSPSALITMGANPGLISSLVKAALIDLVQPKTVPQTRQEWAHLTMAAGVKVIQVAEHDTQVANCFKEKDTFVNTWSVPGLIREAIQVAEIGWGTHEKRLPKGARVQKATDASSICLNRPGCVTQVRSWTPLEGSMVGFCITHGESITLSEYLSFFDGDHLLYRPSVYYAYHPCNDAVLSLRELQMRHFIPQSRARLLSTEIVEGVDELGCLLMGEFGALWYGSQLTIQQARSLLGPNFSATSIQVAIAIVAGAIWLMQHPKCGLLEPEDLDHTFVMEICKPYLGTVASVRSDWNPLKESGTWEEEWIDRSDPWQFQNFRIY